MNKLIILGIVGATVVIGGLLAFMSLLEAAASLTIDTAIVDFKRNDDRVMIRASLSDITPTTNPSDLVIEVCVKNIVLGEQACSIGPPTKIQ